MKFERQPIVQETPESLQKDLEHYKLVLASQTDAESIKEYEELIAETEAKLKKLETEE